MAKKGENFSARDLEEKQEAREIADKIFNYVNSMGHNSKFLAEALTHQHPTLQQRIFAAILLAIEEWAEIHEKGWYDLRNQATCECCAKIMKDLGGKVYLPFV